MIGFTVGMAVQQAIDEALREHDTNQPGASNAPTPPLPLIMEQLQLLSLTCEAMWSLIRERTDLTEEDLSQRVTELDMADGVKDNRHMKGPVDCPKCGSKICRKFSRCLFCGFKAPPESVFDEI
jgi:hypothetical protein